MPEQSVSMRGHASWLLRLAGVTVLIGCGAGVIGILVNLLLHGIEHAAFGYTDGSLLEGALQAPPWRRFVSILAAGVLGGLGWWALRRWGRRVVSVERATAGVRMPLRTTVLNALLQLGIVGLGASIGREAAPANSGHCSRTASPVPPASTGARPAS